MVITEAIHEHVLKVQASAWTSAVEADGEIRDGAWGAELTGDVLDGWPKEMRLVVRKDDHTLAPSCGSRTPTACG
jgi:hypothetical protein